MILEKVEIIQENGKINLYVNGEKIETENTLGIHLDIRYTDGGAVMELTTQNRIKMLLFDDKREQQAETMKEEYGLK